MGKNFLRIFFCEYFLVDMLLQPQCGHKPPSSLSVHLLVCPDLTEARDIGAVRRSREEQASSVSSNSCLQSEAPGHCGDSANTAKRTDTRSLRV